MESYKIVLGGRSYISMKSTPKGAKTITEKGGEKPQFEE